MGGEHDLLRIAADVCAMRGQDVTLAGELFGGQARERRAEGQFVELRHPVPGQPVGPVHRVIDPEHRGKAGGTTDRAGVGQ